MVRPPNDSQNSARSGTARALRQEIGQLQHELRRVQDGLERNPTRELQARARQLRDNIALCERDLAIELKLREHRPGGE